MPRQVLHFVQVIRFSHLVMTSYSRPPSGASLWRVPKRRSMACDLAFKFIIQSYLFRLSQAFTHNPLHCCTSNLQVYQQFLQLPDCYEYSLISDPYFICIKLTRMIILTWHGPILFAGWIPTKKYFLSACRIFLHPHIFYKSDLIINSLIIW